MVLGWIARWRGGNMLNSAAILAAAPDQVSCDIGSQTAILNLKNGIYYGLDSVGKRVWELVQTPRRLGELETTLLSEYDVDAERLVPDVRGLCQKLVKAGLIEIRDEVRV
jgi:hypothetical protein